MTVQVEHDTLNWILMQQMGSNKKYLVKSVLNNNDDPKK